VTAPASQLEVGATLQLAAAAKDSKGAALTRTYSWSSNAPTVASVDANGVVSGVSPGQATITATTDGVTGSVALTVLPIPVAAVLISPRTPSVRQGETTQLSAAVQDAIGRPLNGRVIAWSSQNATVATVSNAGLVTGVAAGTAFIVASSEGKRDSVALRVRSLQAPTVSTTTPAQWTPGAAVTITGTNFSTVATENEVLLNGTRATVTVATATSLSVTVPAASALPCSATGPVPLAVVVNGDTASATANLRVATQRALAVGEHLLLTSSSDVACNEFSATGGRYLVTAFNSATSSGIRTNFQLVGAAATGTSQSTMAAISNAPAPAFGPLRSALPVVNRNALAIGHAAMLAESERMMQRSGGRFRQQLLSRRARARQGDLGVSATARAAFSPASLFGRAAPPVAPPALGDMQWRRMRRSFSDPQSFDSVRVRVVYVGPKLIILEDSANEDFSKMDAEYQKVGTEFDQAMFGLLSNFGDPLAIDSLTDNNARVVAIFSKRVNEYVLSGGGALLGFVTLCDFLAQSDPDPRNVCASSNEGEYFYAIAPNPNGTRGRYSLDTWKRFARGTMIHELKHVVMFVQRLFLDGSRTEETWLEEATAQVATELWARKLYGNRAQRADLRWLDGPNCDYASVSASCADPVEAIGHPFGFLYGHYAANETKSIINNNDQVIYGSSWSFARWLTDQYDGGDEETFLRRLVQQPDDAGIQNVVNRTGRQWPELLGLFSMASLADNYPGGTITDPRLRLPSWNTRDVFAGMNASLVFRNPDGTTTPAFPRQWPMNVRTPSFGNFPDLVRLVTSLPGGGWVAWDISGTQTAAQVLGVRSLNGSLPPSGIGMVVLRVQ
jgi:hypothetical protein